MVVIGSRLLLCLIDVKIRPGMVVSMIEVVIGIFDLFKEMATGFEAQE